MHGELVQEVKEETIGSFGWRRWRFEEEDRKREREHSEFPVFFVVLVLFLQLLG